MVRSSPDADGHHSGGSITSSSECVVHFRPTQQLEAGVVPAERRLQHTLLPFLRNRRRMHAGAVEPLHFALRQLLLLLEQRPALVVDEAELSTHGRQAQVRVVFPQEQAVLGAAREHAIGLARAAGDEVVDQHAEVTLAALRHPGLAALHLERGVDAGDQALGGGFFVAGGAVDLAGEVQPADELGLERGAQVPRIEEVVLDGVAGAGEMRILEAADRAHELPLHVERQAGRDAVRIDLVGLQALGLDENLVRGLVGEAHDLVFDRRAVARADAFDHAGEHRRAIGGGVLPVSPRRAEWRRRP